MLVKYLLAFVYPTNQLILVLYFWIPGFGNPNASCNWKVPKDTFPMLGLLSLLREFLPRSDTYSSNCKVPGGTFQFNYFLC